MQHPRSLIVLLAVLLTTVLAVQSVYAAGGILLFQADLGPISIVTANLRVTGNMAEVVDRTVSPGKTITSGTFEVVNQTDQHRGLEISLNPGSEAGFGYIVAVSTPSSGDSSSGSRNAGGDSEITGAISIPPNSRINMSVNIFAKADAQPVSVKNLQLSMYEMSAISPPSPPPSSSTDTKPRSGR